MKQLNSKYILSFFGFFVIPFLTILLCLKGNMIKTNFTGLATQSSSMILFHLWSCVSILVECILIYQIGKQNHASFQWICVTLAVCMMIPTWIPYSTHHAISSLLHVGLSYIAFIYYNICLYIGMKYHLNHPLVKIYIGILTLCAVITMTQGSINGFVEVVYSISISVLLTIRYLQTTTQKK